MKRRIALLLACALLLVLPGCKDTPGTSLQELEKAGKLTVALPPDCSPYITQTADGTCTGIEIDLLSAVCDELGVLLDVQTTDPDKILLAVEKEDCHLGAGTLSDETVSGSRVLYSTPYAKARLRLIIKAGSSAPDVDYLAQKVIAVYAGSYAESYCLSNIIPTAVYDTYEEAVQAVLDGTADGLLADEFIADSLIDEYSSGTLSLVLKPVTTATYAFAMAEGSEEVIARIDAALSDLLADGTMHAIYEQYDLIYTSPNG